MFSKIKHSKLSHDYGEIKMSALYLILDPLFSLEIKPNIFKNIKEEVDAI